MKRILGALSDVVVYFWRVYFRGWSMIIRAAGAYLIISLFMLPLAGIASVSSRITTPYDDTLAGVGVRLLLAGLALLIYVPPVFYVAASWVGFCRRIEDSDKLVPDHFRDKLEWSGPDETHSDVRSGD